MIDKLSSDPIDQEVGERVRLQRRIRGLSQTELADALGVSYQQLQKYEKGKNRIGASRLQKIAEVLEVPVASFFKEHPNCPGDADLVAHRDELAYFLATEEGVELNRAFFNINDARLRRSIVGMVKLVAVTHNSVGSNQAA